MEEQVKNQNSEFSKFLDALERLEIAFFLETLKITLRHSDAKVILEEDEENVVLSIISKKFECVLPIVESLVIDKKFKDDLIKKIKEIKEDIEIVNV